MITFILVKSQSNLKRTIMCKYIGSSSVELSDLMIHNSSDFLLPTLVIIIIILPVSF